MEIKLEVKDDKKGKRENDSKSTVEEMTKETYMLKECIYIQNSILVEVNIYSNFRKS